MNDPLASGFRIGDYAIQPSLGRIVSTAGEAHVEPRAMDVLVALARRAGETVSRDDLIQAVWKHPHVSDEALTRCISLLRQVLGDDRAQPRYLETIPKRGYRLVATVQIADGRAAADYMLAGGLTPDRARAPADSDWLPASSNRNDFRPPFESGGVAMPDWRRTNLPLQPTPIIGREAELAEVRALLSAHRLLTLIGSGGVGKTRLALEVGLHSVAEYSDGVWLVELGPLADPELIPSTVAAALGVELGDAKTPLKPLMRSISTRQMLLLLDNCEHLVDAVAAFAEAVMGAAPGVRLLATSQVLLRIAGEQAYRVPSLAVPGNEQLAADVALGAGAVQLFVERAKAADPHFSLDDSNATTVAAISRRLDGIPLAIEMAAARVPMLGVEEIEQKLDERFRVLIDGRRTALPRQQTLRATLDWSCGLLSGRERSVLNRLAVFAGGFTLEAAVAVASDEAIARVDVDDLLAQLVARSLAVADVNDTGTRYRLLETTRAYALERLAESGQTDSTKRRHAQFFRDLFERAPYGWLRMRDVDWRRAFLPERDNVRAALDWALGPGGDPATGIALAGASGAVWAHLSLYGEGRKWLDAAVARIGAQTPDSDQARLWLWLGVLTASPWAPDEAVVAVQRAVDLYRRLDDGLGLGYSLARLGGWLMLVVRFEEAERVLAEALPILERAGEPRALAEYYRWSGSLKMMTGDPASARTNYEKALSLYRAAGAERLALDTLGTIVDMTWALGDLDAALAGFREILVLQRKSPLTTKVMIGLYLTNIAGLHTERGELAEALAAAREGLPLVKSDGLVWFLLDHLALRTALAGNIAGAARLAGFADASYAAKKTTRQPNEARARDRLQVLLREKLAPEERERLLAAGAKMNEGEACRIALAE